MQNLGLFKGLPALTLTPEQRSALFRENQKNRKLTRVPGDQFRPLPGRQATSESPANKHE